MAQNLYHLAIFSFFLIISSPDLINVSAKIVYEDGYTVSTVIDGNHINLNPHSVLSGSDSLNDLVVLDSSNSVFYTFSLPISLESVPKRFAGNGAAGFSDGERDSAMFNKPRSFAVDSKGNVYVADRSNLAIRKISNSGVTTIAGGYTKKPGHADGPGKNASFSEDFEITFVPSICALLVSDHGHKLIRQINLKSEDCSESYSSGWGISLAWTLGLVASCLLSFIVGFAARPYITSTVGTQRNQMQGDMEPLLQSDVEESSRDAMLRHQKRSC